MKNQALLLLLLGTLPAWAQTPTPRISGAKYAGNSIRIGFTAQANPFQTLDSARIEVVLVTQLTTSLLSAAALGDNADHPVLATWASGAPDSIRIALKPTFRPRYFIAACYSALTGGRRIRSPWSVLSNTASGPIALSAAPDSLEETPQAQVTILEDAGIGPGALVEASFSLIDRSSPNTEILVAAQGSVPLLLPNPESITSSTDGRLVVASSLAGAISQSNANTNTVLIRETRSGSPTLYRLYHHLDSMSAGDTVHLRLINPDGRELHAGPLFAHRPGTSFRMGRTLQSLVCHPLRNTTDLFSGFSPVHSADSVAVGILAMAMLRTHLPQASAFVSEETVQAGIASDYLQAYERCIAAWSTMAATNPGLARMAALQTAFVTLANGPVAEPGSDAPVIRPPVAAFDAYTRFELMFPKMTQAKRGLAVLTLVSPNVTLHTLLRAGMKVRFPELANSAQVAGLLFPADSGTLNPVLRHGLYLRGRSTEQNATTQYGLVQKVVRRPLGLIAVSDSLPGQRVSMPGGMVKEGILQAGLGELGFQIWPRSEKGPWITFAPQGQFVVGRQQRRMVVDHNKRMGELLHLDIGGLDSAFLMAEGSPQVGEQPGMPKATWQDLRATDTVGSDTGALWFRALDWSRTGSGDTVLHRVFEKRGALLNLCLGKQTDGPADSVLYHRALLEERLRMRSGCPEFLGKLKGIVQLTLPPGTQAYRVPAGQFLGPQHRLDNASPLWRKTLTGVQLRLNLELESHRQTLSALFDGEPWSLLVSDRGKTQVEMQYLPPGDISGGITSRVGLEEERDETSVIVADFDHNGKVDSLDEAAARRGERWSIWSDSENKPKNMNSDASIDEKGVELLSYLPFRVRLRGPLSPYQKVFLQGNSDREISIIRQDSGFVDTGFYIKNTAAETLVSTLQAKPLDNDHEIELGKTSGNHWGLIGFQNQGDNSINLMYSREGLIWNENVLKVECTDILRKITVFSARYNPEVSFAEDEEPQEESIDSYRWEGNRLLNQSPYSETTFKSFLHRQLKEFDGIDLGRPDEALKDSLNVVYIHGFNVHESLGSAYSADRSIYKRLYHMGLKGNLISFHWFGDINGFQSRTVPGIDFYSAPFFSMDQSHGFRTSAIFRSILKNSLGGYRKALLGHSLGNQVALDMLRLSKQAGDAPILERYMMVEAAVWRETLIPVDSANLDSMQRTSWRGLFQTGLNPAIKFFSSYNPKDKMALGAMCFNESSKGSGWGATSVRVVFDFPKKICTDADVAALRTPELLAYCKRSELESIKKCADEGMGSRAPIGRTRLLYDSIQDSLIVDIDSRQIKGPDKKFLQEHSYYAFDPLWYTTHLYDKLLH